LNSIVHWIPNLGGRQIACPACGVEFTWPAFEIQKARLLIVEGRDDEEFFDALVNRLGRQDIQVAGIGGKTKLRARLKALVKDPAFEGVQVLAIVRDADADPKSAFESVKDALKAAGLPSPRRAMSVAKGHPKTGVMILPSIDKKGELENLCLEAVINDPAMDCTEDFFDCLQKKGGARRKKDVAKAKVRVFLAAQEDPTLPLGLAAKKGYWPLDHPAFGRVKRFLQSL
jgi:hypothetical protein